MAKHLELNDVSKPALIRAARNAVAAALAGEFPADPLIAPALSRAVSCIGSVVKRHGGLIELSLAGALTASDRFIVLTNVALPLTKGAIQLLDARNSDENLARIKLSADSEASGIVNIDLVVVDPEAGWAGAYEIKRGNGTTEHGKRRPTVRKLRAARLVLASYVRQLGYGEIESVTSAVIDYCGASGFDPEFTLTREQLDGHFGVPVVATVEAMTAALSAELQAALPGLFGPFLEQLSEPDAGNAAGAARTANDCAAPVPAAATGGETAMDLKILRTLTAMPAGPGPARRAMRPSRLANAPIGAVPGALH